MDYINIIGFIGGGCTTISFIPQVVLVLKTKSTKDISLMMYSVFVFGISLWLLYGILSDALPVIIPNLITFVLAGSILFMKVKNEIIQKNR
ncbi:SemiSWEET transporter [Citrobacter enshiensis]|uniref:SemiSWEET transporter n=1 Tax=Citrobacter enshiensis TaxID=2971264 RepID=A0ABT8Q125_9ENTR|nr:SemiSWEET transporter [Citrobacter enshiensis]MDN8601279.1 SemiSWEET transporter [Citrobacter enshiensis]WET39980.1 SemiSWEET transporter [Citrobacter enshiensis]